MAWIAISDHDEQRFSLSGLGSDAGRAATQREKLSPDTLLTRGSILLETRLAPEGCLQTLLSYRRMHPWVSGFSIQSIPNGGIAVVVNQGAEVFHTALAHDGTGRGDTLRITWSWDAPARWGRLAIERVGSDRLFLSRVDMPKPLMLADLQVMAMDPMQRHLDPDVSFFALSDDIEPVGPMPTLTTHVPIATPYGYRMAGQLKRGDLVRTADDWSVPVLDTVRRTVPARGSFRPVRLRAPYFGLTQDIIVAPQQRLVIGGSDVEYMFGQERVLVPAGHLVNGTAAQFCSAGTTASYTQIVLPEHEAMQAPGTLLESLHLGRLRRKPDHLNASLLCHHDRSVMPEHANPAYPVLKHFEAVTLAQKRAA